MLFAGDDLIDIAVEVSVLSSKSSYNIKAESLCNRYKLDGVSAGNTISILCERPKYGKTVWISRHESSHRLTTLGICEVQVFGIGGIAFIISIYINHFKRW